MSPLWGKKTWVLIWIEILPPESMKREGKWSLLNIDYKFLALKPFHGIKHYSDAVIWLWILICIPQKQSPWQVLKCNVSSGSADHWREGEKEVEGSYHSEGLSFVLQQKPGSDARLRILWEQLPLLRGGRAGIFTHYVPEVLVRGL